MKPSAPLSERIALTEKVTVFAPATVANVVAGFDVLGFAVEELGDEVTVSFTNSGKVTLDEVTGDDGILPREADRNISSLIVSQYIAQLKQMIGEGSLSPARLSIAPESGLGVSVRLRKGLPIGSGLGSSSASIAAALMAINELFGAPFSISELIPLAMEGERLTCGTAHPDNVVPALLGGLILIRSKDPLDLVPVSYPKSLYVSLLHPQIEILTRDARKALPSEIPLALYVRQSAHLAGMILGFETGNLELLRKSMKDEIVEPIRAKRIPGFDAMKEVALKEGAIGFGISGSGPSLFALSQNKERGSAVLQGIQEVCEKEGIPSTATLTKISSKGAREVLS